MRNMCGIKKCRAHGLFCRSFPLSCPNRASDRQSNSTIVNIVAAVVCFSLLLRPASAKASQIAKLSCSCESERAPDGALIAAGRASESGPASAG